MNGKVLKIASIVVPLAGAAIGLVASFVEDKKLDDKVATKVAEAIANSTSKES